MEKGSTVEKSILIPKAETIPLVNEKGKPAEKFTVGKPGIVHPLLTLVCVHRWSPLTAFICGGETGLGRSSFPSVPCWCSWGVRLHLTHNYRSGGGRALANSGESTPCCWRDLLSG